jgi:hypothetical protein
MDLDQLEYDEERDTYIIDKSDLEKVVGHRVQDVHSSFTSGRSEDPTDSFGVDAASAAGGTDDSQQTQVLSGDDSGNTEDSQQSRASRESSLVPVEADELVTIQLRDWTTGYAMELLVKLRQNAEKSGLCLMSLLKPSKQNGYVQASFRGANKVMTVQEILLLVSGLDIEARRAVGRAHVPPVLYHASHRCGHPACLIPDHICIESAEENNSRKGCLVWFQCRGHKGCKRWFLVCPHNPPCIKQIPNTNYDTWEETLRSDDVHPTVHLGE